MVIPVDQSLQFIFYYSLAPTHKYAQSSKHYPTLDLVQNIDHVGAFVLL